VDKPSDEMLLGKAMYTENDRLTCWLLWKRAIEVFYMMNELLLLRGVSIF
jgi:hypothetical protein